MKIRTIICGIVLFTFICTCYMCKEDYSKLGCDGSVGLKENYMDFGDEGGKHFFKVNNSAWWVNSWRTIVDGDTIMTTLYYSDSTSNFPIKEKWFSIEIFDGGLTIYIDENKEKSLRELFVGLQSGNCFDGILVEQSAGDE